MVIFICGNLFLRIAGKIAKIRTLKIFVPHGSSMYCKVTAFNSASQCMLSHQGSSSSL